METEVSSKSNSSRPMVNRINSVIPEASEREELTVNEAVHQTIEFPIEPSTAKKEKVASKYLTDFERTEVDEYEQLYYLAENSAKIKATKLERLVNNGFDDEEGYYRVQKGDHIAYRFQLIEIIGKGAFG
jgi:dual specificity tyrosine-phosphorylation-regulated kinase 2/3/4